MKVRTQMIAAVLASLAASGAGAATFSARETHRGLVIDRTGSPAGRLAPNGWLFRRPGDPTFVYREGGVVTAGVWESGSSAIVRSGTTESAPIVGRIVPSWNDDELMLSIDMSVDVDPESATRFTGDLPSAIPAPLAAAAARAVDAEVDSTYDTVVDVDPTLRR
jgi:hypothetical protein